MTAYLTHACSTFVLFIGIIICIQNTSSISITTNKVQENNTSQDILKNFGFFKNVLPKQYGSGENTAASLEHMIRHGKMRRLKRKYRLMENDHQESELQASTESPQLSEEDIKVQREWGGNCTAVHWARCMTVRMIAGRYWEPDPKKGEPNIQYPKTHNTSVSIDCNLLSGLCLHNGWTVNECHLLCMSKCNLNILIDFNKYVKHVGVCDYL